jgi:outer membrane protein OmpA-like peptidoglycan-associated protein
MAGSMLDSILALVTPEMKQSLAARLGESPQTVQTGLGTAAAAALAGCARKAGDTSFLGRIINMASDASGQNLMGNLSSLASSGPSGATADLVNGFLPIVFGGKLDKVSGLLSQEAGVSSSSMSGLLQMAVPLIIGFLGKLNSSGSLSLGSLAGMLRSEVPNLEKYVPANLFSARGQTASRAASDVAGGPGLKKSALWSVLLGVFGAILLSWLAYRALNTGNVAPQSTMSTATQALGNAASTAGHAANSAWAALGELFKVKLPDGTELDVPRLGVENKLILFIQDPAPSANTETWFDFDRLLFDTGQATLQPASQEQLHNIALILKAYPNVNIRIGGYTDNSGDAGPNMQLSQARAESVMASLVALGVDPTRMTAKGYGEDHPVADNSGEEGRQKNRRISMRVTAK